MGYFTTLGCCNSCLASRYRRSRNKTVNKDRWQNDRPNIVFTPLPYLTMANDREYHICMQSLGLQNTTDIQLPRAIRDGKLEVSLVATRILDKYHAKYEDSEGVIYVQDSKGHTYTVIGKAVFRWRMKDSYYTERETFYITNGLRGDVDALLRKDIGGSFQNMDNAAEGFVLEMPKQSDEEKREEEARQQAATKNRGKDKEEKRKKDQENYYANRDQNTSKHTHLEP